MINRSAQPRNFLSQDEKHLIVEAIKAAESKTSGEIRVHLDRRCKGAPIEAARFTFDKLGMHRTREKNGVLIYLAVHDRCFAVVGDTGLDGKFENGFWDGVREQMGKSFAGDKFGEGIAGAIRAIGEKMAAPFPHTDADKGALSDDISVGRS